MLILLSLIWFVTGETAECEVGRYGENCSHSCSLNCRLHLNGELHCNKTTGECSEGCRPGFYTQFCNASCRNCPKFVCDLIDGSCAQFESKPCENKPCTRHIEGKWRSTAVITISLFLVGTIVGISIFTCRLRRRKSLNVHAEAVLCEKEGFLLNHQRKTSDSVTSSMTATECPNCKHQRCDSTDNCSDGCIPGFAGPKCLKPCPLHCLNSICHYNENTGAYPCIIGCKPGYYGRQCKTPCKSTDEHGRCDSFSGTSPDCGGTHSGEKCQTSCRSDCDGLACDNRGKCYKEVCIPGRYGADCSTPCESECEVCHKDTGQCLKLKDGKDVPYSSKCVCDISGDVHMKDYSGYLIAIIILLLIIAAVGIGIFYQNYNYLWNTSRIRVKDDCREVVVIHGQNDNSDTRRRTRSSTKR